MRDHDEGAQEAYEEMMRAELAPKDGGDDSDDPTSVFYQAGVLDKLDLIEDDEDSGECWGVGNCDCPACLKEETHRADERADAAAGCAMCAGAGYLTNVKGGIVTCPECNGKGDPNDDDAQCVCGTYRSEHNSAMGCGNYQTKGQWASERDWIVNMDEDTYEYMAMQNNW